MGLRLQPSDAYQPGACNIGPAEIARRRRFAGLATVGTVVLAAALLVLGVPAAVRILIFPLVAGTAVAWLQVTRRFCVAYAAAGVRNFGPLGAVATVVDVGARREDRRTALGMVLQGIVIGFLITLAFVLLPLPPI